MRATVTHIVTYWRLQQMNRTSEASDSAGQCVHTVKYSAAAWTCANGL